MGVSSYNIYRSDDPYAVDWGIAYDSSTINSYIDMGVSSQDKYFYYITAED